ncbi:hypothetical protein [Candidatus Poriferisodalis sp.]|uniref:hypothetical protein n=1 Tax=Candidatus Poriferisodalis sp. TaxID=3101277 RepID=UPI003B5AE4DD
MTDFNDEPTDEDYLRMSEEFEQHEFTQDELDRIFATERSTPFPASEPASTAT